MFTMLLEDYRQTFSSNLKLTIKQTLADLFMVLIYGSTGMVRVIQRGETGDCINGILLLICFSGSYLMSRLYSNHLQKIYFYLPIGNEMRKKYIKSGYLLRVGIPVIVYSVLALGLVAAGGIAWEKYVLIVLTILLGSAIHNLTFYDWGETGKRELHSSFGIGVGKVITIVLVVSEVNFKMDNFDVDAKVCAVALLILFLLLVGLYKSVWPKILLQGCDFENNFQEVSAQRKK